MTAAEKLLAVATQEIGYLEKASNALLNDPKANAGYANYTKYARDLDCLGVYNGHKNGYAWCDMFVDWCFYTAFGLKTGMAMLYQIMGGLGAGCTYSAKYFKDRGQFFKTPQVGDQIFFTNDNHKTSYHTGLVVDVNAQFVTTIEGNTSSANGVVANGGSVEKKKYSINYNKIHGYGRPNFAMVPEEELTMSLDEFKKLWAEMRSELQDNDHSQYSEDARQWAVSEGFVKGNGTAASDGSENMMWEDLLTREQFVTVLYRFMQKYCR